MEKINWKKFIEGNKQLVVRGVANTEERKRLVGEAIKMIQEFPETALLKGYIGFKNYEAFGDQRCDCEYGMGPRHGSIVFSVGRSSSYRDGKVLTDDAIYFLKCFRDAPAKTEDSNDRCYKVNKNIQVVYNEMQNHELESAKLQEWLDVIEVDENDSEIVPLHGEGE